MFCALSEHLATSCSHEIGDGVNCFISHYQSLSVITLLFLWAWKVRAGESAHLGTVLHTFARGYRVEGVDIIRNS